MRERHFISDLVSVMLMTLSVTLLVSSLILHGRPGNTDHTAARIEQRVESRLLKLESYVYQKADVDIPEDMVIYRYAGDSLCHWQNQFPVMNDDISSRVVFQKLVNPRRNFQSPLAEVTDSLSFVNLGPRWYLVRSYDLGDTRAIAGLEIMNTMDRNSYNGVNPRLRLNSKFSVKPLTVNGGSEVRVGGRPQFCVICDAIGGSAASEADNGIMIWMSFILFVLVGMISLRTRPNVKQYLLFSGAMVPVSAIMYVWGRMSTDLKVFSPLLFAGGQVLHSLGIVIIINILVVALVWGLHVVKADLRRRLEAHSLEWPALALSIAAMFGIVCYMQSALKSIILNSNIQLEIFNIGELSWWTAVVYMSFLPVLLCVPVLLKIVEPYMGRFLGRSINVTGRLPVAVMSALMTLFVLGIVSVQGFRKESNRMEVWANRLAVDRDIILEMRLRRIERSMAEDMIIASLSMMEESDNIIQNLVTDNYLSSAASDYRISAMVVRASSSADRLDRLAASFNKGEPLADGSAFRYMEMPSGLPMYSGHFIYFNEVHGVTHVLMEIVPKFAGGDRGYMSLLHMDHPGRMRLPSGYSSARYRGSSIFGCAGNYPYPVRLDSELRATVYGSRGGTFRSGGYRHFYNVVSEDEAVVISRPVVDWFSYMSEAFFIYLVIIFLFFIVLMPRRVRKGSGRYYMTRISWLVMVALTLTLVSMLVASVVFSYRRNEVNINTILSDKVRSIQSMIQEGVVEIAHDRTRMQSILEGAATDAGTDISLYFPDGRLMASTFPDIVERSFSGCRMNHAAYENIIVRHKRHFMNRETVEGVNCYCMYAPVMDDDGRIVAILGAPYSGSEIYDFEMDALRNLLSITALFLVLLLLSRVLLVRTLEKVFQPLSEIGGKIAHTDLDTLEHIDYDNEDEVSLLVDAYNRMVSQLSENSRKLAQAERDKAWSGMARQVAHEIKNPLTPMKLQLQRIIRLKAKGDPGWQEKFDDVSKVILDHIDILTDTANEFSTFAKLYTEEPTRVNLDAMLQEEISMFDNRDDVSFSYMGLADAYAMAPKPQLTRVFVNLMGNAVQAVEGREGACVLVSLRNSAADGYYDIVFEDNGPGVAEENIGRLFTPNFTTKSGGTGLGLAISRSILEKCDATVSYSRSFALGGACFSIRYPKSS